MIRVCVVSVARSDYGLYRPLLRQIAADGAFDLQLIAAAMHLAPRFGDTVREIVDDGFEIAARVEMTPATDEPTAVAIAMGHGTVGFAETFARLRPDLILVLGDRYEMHAAAVAAVPFLVPIAHIAGGSLTYGAIDDGLRHSITKLSHIHFVETDVYRDRIVQMGEEPWRVHTTGSLSIDNLNGFRPMTVGELNQTFKLALDAETSPLLVTFHSVTREYTESRTYMEAVLGAIEESGLPVVFTYPNADTGGQVIIEMIEAFVERHGKAWAVPHLGTQGYFSLMARAAAMVGNSSSGIIEAASFKLPAVSVGRRQEGRLAPDNVITTGSTKAEIGQGIRKAVSPEFRLGLASLVSPYGNGHAAARMMAVLRQTDPKDPRLIRKTFHDLPQP